MNWHEQQDGHYTSDDNKYIVVIKGSKFYVYYDEDGLGRIRCRLHTYLERSVLDRIKETERKRNP